MNSNDTLSISKTDSRAAFLRLVPALIGKAEFALDLSLPASWNFVLSIVFGLGVWLEYFLLPLSLDIGFSLNHEVVNHTEDGRGSRQ